MDWVCVLRWLLVALLGLSVLVTVVASVREHRRNWWPSSAEYTDPTGW